MVDLIEEAIMWGSNGVPVFPCAENKRPMTKHGHLDASCDATIIEKMFEAAPRAVFIGGAMGIESGLFAVDLDAYKDGGVQQKKILERSGCLPDTRVHITLNDGLHYLYWSPKGVTVKSSKLHATVDIKGEGGYIILPPSPGYKILHDRSVVDAPAALIERINRFEDVTKNMTVPELEAQILEGSDFHDSLTRIAAKRSRAGHDPKFILKDLMQVMASSVASDRYHERHDRWSKITADSGKELSRIVNSASKKFNDTFKDEVAGELFSDVKFPLGNPFEKVVASQDATIPDEFPFDKSYHAVFVEDEAQRDYLLYPLIYQGDTVLLSAAPKAGKTLLTMTMALHIASGIPLGEALLPFGGTEKIAPCPVIYFCLEGQTAVRKRVQAWLKEINGTRDVKLNENDLQLFVVEKPTNLADGKIRQNVVDNIILAELYFEERGWSKLGLIVIDTLTKAIPGKDQNSVADTSELFEIIGMVHNTSPQVSILFVHHDNREGRGPRGSSNILAEPDTILTVKRSKNVIIDGEEYPTMEMDVYMARAIDDNQSYKFAIKPINIGTNKQGFIERAPVIELIDFAVEEATDFVLGSILKEEKEVFYNVAASVLSGVGTVQLMGVHRQIMDFSAAPGAVHYYMTLIGAGTAKEIVATWKILCKENPLDGLDFVMGKDGTATTIRLDVASPDATT